MGFELGPCQILYGNVGGNQANATDLGKTFGGVSLTIEESKQQLKSDQSGEAPEDESITGTTVKVTASLAEFDLNSMAFITKRTVSNNNNALRLDVIANAGTSLMTNAKQVILKPYENGVPSNNVNRWITLHKAGISATVDLVYDSTTQRVMKFEATGYPSANNNNSICTFGNVAVA